MSCIYLSFIRFPPHRELPSISKSAAHGNSFAQASLPPVILVSQPILRLLRPQLSEHRPCDPEENLNLDEELELEVWKFTLEGLLHRPLLHWLVTVLMRNRRDKYLKSILMLVFLYLVFWQLLTYTDFLWMVRPDYKARVPAKQKLTEMLTG